MKLYVDPFSPNARRVLLVLSHISPALEREVEIVNVSLRAGDNRKPEFLAINPNHKVPTLVDGELHLWESNAIAQYLAARAGRTDLWPVDPREQADVSRWQFWMHGHWNPAINPVMFERVIKPLLGREPDLAAIEAKRAEIAEAFALVDAHLGASRQWLALGRLTLADLALAASLTHARPGVLPIEDYPRIVAWFDRVKALPAWAATQPG